MDWKAAALLVTCNLLGGASYAATAAALTGLDPYSLVLLRTAAATPLFLPWIVRGWPKKGWLAMLGVGTLGYAVPLYLGTLGQDMSTSTKAALLVGVEPVTVVLLSALFLRERLTTGTSAAIAASLLGAALIVSQGGKPSGEMRGDLILAAHGFCWALYTVVGKKALESVEPLAFTGIVNAIGAVSLACALPFADVSLPQGTQSWSAMIFLTLAVTFFACVCWNEGLKRVPASSVAPFIFLQPLFGAALGVLRGEPFTAWTAAGGTLILLGVALTKRG